MKKTFKYTPSTPNSTQNFVSHSYHTHRTNTLTTTSIKATTSTANYKPHNQPTMPVIDLDEFFFGKAHYRYDPSVEASLMAYKFGEPAEHPPVQEIPPWMPLPRARARPSSSTASSSSSLRRTGTSHTSSPSPSPSSSSQPQTQRRKRKTPPTDETHPYSKRFNATQKEFLYSVLFED
ncbi:hypothetical protein VNI00_014479 [Paramarasmius palmivorus]|uniref:Uncharacterized protein n=1 Tax=Paramarasmius palmivorus TaxID=297713 RepID=A0AAW0BSL9_9AGAR